jgi:transcriptional regulator with XRE-family HTH domain
MRQSETVGDRITMAMKRANVTREEAAAATRRDVGTVSRWRGDKQSPSEAELKALADLFTERGAPTTSAWLRYGDSPMRVAERSMVGWDDTGHIVSQPPEARGVVIVDGRQLPMWPKVIYDMARAFEIEALNAGASEVFVEYARQRLRDPDLNAFYAGGVDARPMTEQEQIDDYRGVIAELRAQLKRDLARMRK